MSKLTEPNVIRIKPLHYIHVLDNNTNVTRVEVGPMTYTRQVMLLLRLLLLLLPSSFLSLLFNPRWKRKSLWALLLSWNRAEIFLSTLTGT